MSTKYYSQVMKRAGGCCEYCGKDLLVDFETWFTGEEDHIVAGGGDSPENLALACRCCNSMKHAGSPWAESEAPANREQRVTEIARWLARIKADHAYLQVYLEYKKSLRAHAIVDDGKPCEPEVALGRVEPR